MISQNRTLEVQPFSTENASITDGVDVRAIVAAFKDAISKRLQKVGGRVVDSGGEIVIDGEVLLIDGGSRVLRYLFGFMGRPEITVQVNAKEGGKVVESVAYNKKCKGFGFFGGSSEALIKLTATRIAKEFVKNCYQQ